MPAPRRRLGLLLGLAGFLLALDQVTKHLAVSQLGDGRVVPVIGDLLQLRLIRNPGAAFGLFLDLTLVLTIVAMVVVVVILRMARRLTATSWALALGLLLGGVLGNLTDRIFREPEPLHGHVVDFFELPNFPVFNIADSAVVSAAILIAWLSFRGVPYEPVEPEPAAEGDPR